MMIYPRSESDLNDPAYSSNDCQWTSFVLMPNPDVHDQYFDGVTGPQECIIVGSGESHMPIVPLKSGLVQFLNKNSKLRT